MIKDLCECGKLKKKSASRCRKCYLESIMTRGGMAGHKAITRSEYKIWSGIIYRCYNEKYHRFHDYGGRGIKVCERWKDSFRNFLEDMGPRPSKEYSVDRINNDGNYEPDNCRWSTAKVQNSNKRYERKIKNRTSEYKYVHKERGKEKGWRYSFLGKDGKTKLSSYFYREEEAFSEMIATGRARLVNGKIIR